MAAGSVDDEGEKKRKHMAARTKKGHRTTGHDAVATIRLSSELRESVDAWAAKQSDKPARREALLRLVELGVPTANPNPLTPIANRLILAPDERSLRIDLVRLDRTVQVAGCVGSRDPGRSTPTQRAAAQIPEAISVRQY